MWEELDEFDEMEELVSGLKQSVYESREPATIKKYLYGIRRWREWAKTKPTFNQTLPVKSVEFALYIQYLKSTEKSFAPIETAFYSMKWAHEAIFNFQSPTSHALVKSVVEAAKRKLSKPPKQKEHISKDNIMKLYNKLSNSSALGDQRFLCMTTISYAAFLRFSEAANLRRCNLKFENNAIIITITKSKTDPYAQGTEVSIAKSDSECCPYTIAQKYLESINLFASPSSYMFIFRNIATSGKKLVPTNKPITYDSARNIFKKKLKSIGLNPEHFGLHSLRSGGATEAAKFGCSRATIKKHGRWKTDVASSKYIRSSENDLNLLRKNLF